MTTGSRRAFLYHAAAFAALAACKPKAQASSLPPIIDAHIHLYNPERPGGVPWPEKTDTVLYKPALPAQYRSISEPLGICGAIAIECSPLEADNDWLLRVAASAPIVVGIVGDLDPALASFPKMLDRLQSNPLYRGIRYGNLWGRNLGEALKNPAFVANLKLLGGAGLLFETANPNPALIADLIKLTDKVPDVSLVIDHLPQAAPPPDLAARKRYEADLQTLSQRPRVSVKGSEVFRRRNGEVVHDPAYYTDWLDRIWSWFGDDRVLFGSDWPNSDHQASYRDTLALIAQYLASKSQVAQQKYFWKNSQTIYHWQPRTAAQKDLSQ